MATANPLTELVSCTICYEVFDNPKILKCQHSFCASCVRKLKINQQVECPQCRTISRMREIKNDFNKMSLVDFYNKQESDNGLHKDEGQIKKCESCRKPDRLGIWHCAECKISICNDCEGVHKNIPATRNHHLVSTDDNKSSLIPRKFEDLDLKDDHDSEHGASHLNKDIQQPPRTRDFLKLTHRQLKEVKEGRLYGSRPWRLCAIDDTLWCTCEDGLYLYNKWSCQFTKCIRHNTIKDAKGIIQDHKGNIVVACAENSGLLYLDPDGRFKSYISEGSFSDVSLNNQLLYAYEYKEGKIFVFYFVKDHWVQKEVIEITNIQGRDADAICVTTNYIYLSAYNHAKLLKYKHDGKLHSEHGTGSLSDTEGELWGPTLCDVDEYGNALLADCWKRKNYLQICRNRGDWSGIRTENDEMEPPILGEQVTFDAKLKFQASQTMKTGTAYAVVDDECTTIWIIRSSMLVWELVRMESTLPHMPYYHHYDW